MKTLKKKDLPPIKVNIFSLFKIYRLIKKFLNSLKTKKGGNMCLKKLFPNWFKPDPEPIPDPIPDPITGTGKKTALLFAINNYPGSVNDLNGCINDQMDVTTKLNQDFPGFVIKQFRDSEVTRYKFMTEIENAIALLHSGDVLLIHYSGHGTQVFDEDGDEVDKYDEAVYLYDQPVIDDDLGYALTSIPNGATVLLIFDSCFSGTINREFKENAEDIKNRFVPLPGKAIRHTKKIRFDKEEMKWIVFSGCGEHQTSADAYINGKYHGAFTYYAIRTLTPGITYREWMNKIHDYLPSKDFDQDPTLEGKENLFDHMVLV